ncbi:MAG TPA: methyltransferase, partial [Herpetosiphonaceae bacterium]
MTNQEIAPEQGQASQALFGIVASAWSTRVLQVGAELGIADLLKDGPKTLAELAEATETHGPALSRLMRALVALGIFTEQEPGTYGMTDLSWHLCRDYPGSLRNFIVFFGLDWSWSLWSELPYAIKTGKSAMRHVHGMNVWEYIDAHPEHLNLFNKGMNEFSTIINPSIIEAYDFSGFQSLVDVGGGYGNFLQLLAERNPSFQAILFERPSVIEEAKAIYAQTPLGSQFTLVGGDFLKEV